MNLMVHLKRACAKAQLPTAALVAILQRSPVLQGVIATEGVVAASSIGTLMRSAAIAVAALGAIDATAGATLLASSLTPNPDGPLPPFNAAVGVKIEPVAFTIANLISIGSWTVTGQLPPGLILTTLEPNGGTLKGYGGGNLDATTATNEVTTPILEGTPTAAGTYNLSFQGFWKGGESGGPYGGKGVSAVFPYTIVVSGGAPEFTTQPMSAKVTGGTVALNGFAVGATAYQWMLNGSTPIAGATSPLLLESDASAATGTYTCVATNNLGSTTSNPATISITSTEDVGRLTNISTRSQVGTGGSLLIAGFAVGGAGTTGKQSLLIRGSGPALIPFGVSGTLPDPQLQLFSSTSPLGSNAGWTGSQAISSAASSVGAFAWNSPTSKDAALLVSLPLGSYTSQIAGASGDTGIALAEVYDATPAGTYTPTTPRIINLSARVQVGTGDNILIAGFSIGGSTSKTVLIRASGPGLVQFGVPGTLPDPLLEIYSGTTFLAGNQGWGGDTRISTLASSAGAFTWLSSSSADSSIVVTLPPGAYTAHVSGAVGDTGVSLIEIYDLP
jgi:hypothetical protein